MLVLDFRQCRDMLGSLLDDVNVKPFKVQCREMLGSLLDDQHQAVQSTHGNCVLF